jgi:hypothetical protein
MLEFKYAEMPRKEREHKVDLTTLKSMGGTWLRASVAAVLALYLNGETDPKKLSAAFLAGIAGPALKFLNPKDKSYGLGAK